LKADDAPAVNESEIHALAALPPEKNFVTHWEGNWVNTRTGVIVLSRKIILPVP
jgi:hypothetical protein